MIFRHQILMGFGDGQPHELRELYAFYARKVKPEEAARVFRDTSRLSGEEKLRRGRIRILTLTLCELRNKGFIKFLAGTDLHRSHVATEKGLAYIKELEAKYGISSSQEEAAKPRRRLGDEELDEPNKLIRENLQKLIGAEWTEQELLFVLATENVTEEQAERGFVYYSDNRKKEVTGPERLWLGKRMMFSKKLHHLHNEIERKVENGKKYVRWKRKGPEGNADILQFKSA